MTMPRSTTGGEPDFAGATRKLLFRRNDEDLPAAKIPGAGKSAAESPRRHVRVKVTMNLDGDILKYLKDQAEKEGLPYQTLINQVLREHVFGSRQERIAADVAEILFQDENFLKNLMTKVRSRELNDKE